jgi:hypothetical protein
MRITLIRGVVGVDAIFMREGQSSDDIVTRRSHPGLSSDRRNVRSSHKADIPTALLDVRYWG